MLDISGKNILRFSNGGGTCGNAVDIFNHIQHLRKSGRIAALRYRYTYFRVLCCYLNLSIFLQSVLARVLHPCIALALWKVLKGCGCCVLMGRAHLAGSMLFVYLCTSLLWPDCGKDFTGSLGLQCLAAAWMKVRSISQALWSCTCVWKLQREKHLRITQCGFHIRASQPRSMWNLRSRPRITVLVIVRISFRLSFGSATKKQKTHASKRNLLLLCMAGSIWLASQEWFPHLRFCYERGHSTTVKGSAKFKTISEHKAKVSAIFQWQGQQTHIWVERFCPSIHPDLIDSISWVEVVCHRSIRLVNEKCIYIDSFYMFLLSFTAQEPVKIEKTMKNMHLNSHC